MSLSPIRLTDTRGRKQQVQKPLKLQPDIRELGSLWRYQDRLTGHSKGRSERPRCFPNQGSTANTPFMSTCPFRGRLLPLFSVLGRIIAPK